MDAKETFAVARAAAVDGIARRRLCDGGGVVDACNALRQCVHALAAPGLVDIDSVSGRGHTQPVASTSHLDVLAQYTASAMVVRNCVSEARARSDAGAAGAADVLLAFLDWERGAGEGGSEWTAATARAVRTTWQCLANYATADDAIRGAVWSALAGGGAAAPRRNVLLHALHASARADAGLAAVVTGVVYTCCRRRRGVGGDGWAALRALTRDAGVFAPLLALTSTAVGGGGGGGGGVDVQPPPAPPSPAAAAEHLAQWSLLLAEEVVRCGAAADALASACAGMPLVLAATSDSDSAAGGAGGGRARLTLEAVTLLHLLEAVIEGGAAGGDVSGGDASGDERSGDGDAPGLPTLSPADAEALASRVGDAIAEAEGCAAAPRAVGIDAAAEGSGRAAAVSVVLRPLVLAACMLCDLVADALVADAARREAAAPGAALRAAAVLQLAPVLRLLRALTPPPPPPSTLPAPDDTSDDGAAASGGVISGGVISGSARARGGGNGDAEGEGETSAGAGGAGAPLAQPLPSPAADSPPPADSAEAAAAASALRRAARAGARSSLTRYVALSVHAAGAHGAAAVLAAPGGVFAVLNQCVMAGAADPVLREWGLMAVRNLCAAAPDGVPPLIAALRAERVTAAPELAALGVRGGSGH